MRQYMDNRYKWIDKLDLDDWQQEVLDTNGNICLRSGRQVGKSFIIGIKAAKYALENPNKLIMVIAFTEKQANLLFAKILFNIVTAEKEDKTKYIAKPKPTKHVIHLKNGSTVHCYAAGDTGFGIMGFTIDLLIADEAAWIKEEVWNSVTPALSVTKGNIWLLSTPYLCKGFYYDCFNDDSFTSFHQSHEDCPRSDPDFYNHKKKTLTKAQYAQMYLGEFVDDFYSLFSKGWIENVCILSEFTNKEPEECALGVDLAGMGGDETTFEILTKQNDKIRQIHHEMKSETRQTDNVKDIIQLNNEFKLMDRDSIGVDGGGLGVGVVDFLLEDDETKYKIVDLNNAKRIKDRDKGTTRLLKEAMYANLVMLGERGRIKLFDNDEIKESLSSITIEKKEGSKDRIIGRYSHIAEGLIRAAWLLKGKDLNPQVYSIKV